MSIAYPCDMSRDRALQNKRYLLLYDHWTMKKSKKALNNGPFESLIDNWRGRLFTKRGDATWKKFVKQVVAPALGLDGTDVPLDPELLERVVSSSNYADEYRARVLFLALITEQAEPSPIYWPYKRIYYFEKPLRDLNQSLYLFMLEVITRSIAFLASADHDPGIRQSLLSAYSSRNVAPLLPFLIQSIGNKHEVEKVLDTLVTADLACSYDNYDDHPLNILYNREISEQLKIYLDRRVQSVIAQRIREQNENLSEQGETLGRYIFLAMATLAGLSHRKTSPVSTVRLVQQLRFILDMHARIQCLIPRIHRINTLNILRIFGCLQGSQFDQLRREVSLFVLITNDDLYLHTSVIGHETAYQGACLMLESLMSDEDTHQIKRIQDAIMTYEVAATDDIQGNNRVLTDRINNTNAYFAKRNVFLARMAASDQLIRQP